MFQRWPKRDPNKHYYLVPNDVFNLGLSSHEIAVYNYLLRCEDRRTYQCHPSYRTIGRAVRLSENTVRKYVAGLEEKGLIRTESSTIITKDGRVRNGSLIYTIRPIQEALEQNYQRQFRQAEESVERARVQQRLAELEQRSNVKKEESA
jgi:predicted transcriptional regulator